MADFLVCSPAPTLSPTLLCASIPIGCVPLNIPWAYRRESTGIPARPAPVPEHAAGDSAEPSTAPSLAPAIGPREPSAATGTTSGGPLFGVAGARIDSSHWNQYHTGGVDSMCLVPYFGETDTPHTLSQISVWETFMLASSPFSLSLKSQ